MPKEERQDPFKPAKYALHNIATVLHSHPPSADKLLRYMFLSTTQMTDSTTHVFSPILSVQHAVWEDTAE